MQVQCVTTLVIFVHKHLQLPKHLQECRGPCHCQHPPPPPGALPRCQLPRHSRLPRPHRERWRWVPHCSGILLSASAGVEESCSCRQRARPGDEEDVKWQSLKIKPSAPLLAWSTSALATTELGTPDNHQLTQYTVRRLSYEVKSYSLIPRPSWVWLLQVCVYENLGMRLMCKMTTLQGGGTLNHYKLVYWSSVILKKSR